MADIFAVRSIYLLFDHELENLFQGFIPLDLEFVNLLKKFLEDFLSYES